MSCANERPSGFWNQRVAFPCPKLGCYLMENARFSGSLSSLLMTQKWTRLSESCHLHECHFSVPPPCHVCAGSSSDACVRLSEDLANSCRSPNFLRFDFPVQLEPALYRFHLLFSILQACRLSNTCVKPLSSPRGLLQIELITLESASGSFVLTVSPDVMSGSFASDDSADVVVGKEDKNFLISSFVPS